MKKRRPHGATGNSQLAKEIRRKRFATEFVKDFNASAAYRRAGYKTRHFNSAATAACKLLHDPEVLASIRAEEGKHLHTISVSAGRVIEETARIAHFDPRDLLDASGQPLPLAALPTHVATALGVELDADGKIKKLTPYDKMEAIALLAKHLNLLKDQPPPPQWTLDPATLATMTTEDLERALQHADAIQKLLAGKASSGGA